MTPAEAQELESALTADRIHMEWRTEIRVDGLEPEVLSILARAGLRVLDIGLESASASTLTIMNKTKGPQDYLDRASMLLRTARAASLFAKVNFLIHPGDTSETVTESWAWLQDHSEYISGISSGVTIEYPGTPLSINLPRYERLYGTAREPHPLSKWGVFNLRPSTQLSHSEAVKLATRIAQSLQTRTSFVASKSFGYLGSKPTEANVLEQLPEASHDTPYRSDD